MSSITETPVTMDDIATVDFSAATDEDNETLRGLDYTKMTAIATCPTWGLIRYIHNKRFDTQARAMALEAGGAAHEAYAACRLWQLGMVDGHMQHMERVGKQLFGGDRFESMRLAVDEREDVRNQMLNFCLDAFYTSGYYDDPMDNRRTTSNIEEALIAYLDRWNSKWSVYVHDVDDPQSFVGIEIPVNVAVRYTTHDGRLLAFRLIGRADGLHHHGGKLTLHENKTASRLNDAWAQSFHMSHQVTGYCLGVSAMIGMQIERCQVMGMAIPLPRSYDYGGLVNELVHRHAYQYRDWMQWALWCVQTIEQYEGDLLHDAPKFTHSCNRYFRPCSFIPYCGSPREERAEIYDDMIKDEWNPLEAKHGD